MKCKRIGFLIAPLILLIGFYGMVFADTTSDLPANTDPQLTDYLYWIDVSAPIGHKSHKILWGTLLDDTKGNGHTTYLWSADKIYDQLALKLDDTQLDDTKGNGDTTYIWSANKVFDQLALKLTITDIEDTPVNNETAAPISSNWAYDHAAAADPHTGYMLESNIGFGANNYLKLAASPGTPDTTKFLRDDGTWVTPAGAGGDLSASDINTPAKLETVSNLGAYSDTLLGFANASSLFDALVYADSIDSAHINWGEPITVPFDNYIFYGDSGIKGGSDDNGSYDLTADISIRLHSPQVIADGNLYALTYTSDSSVTDAELKTVDFTSSGQTQMNLRAIGDASVTDENVAVFDTDGYHLKDVPVNIDSTGNVSGIASLVMAPVATPTIAGYATADSGAITFSLSATSDGTDSTTIFKTRMNSTLTNIFGVEYTDAPTIFWYANFIFPDGGGMYPYADNNGEIGASDAKFANVWTYLVNGADFSYNNGWRTLESEKYKGYPKGIAIGNTCFEDGKVWDKMPDGCKPVFVVAEDFIEYKGTRVTKSTLEKLIEMVKERDYVEKIINQNLSSVDIPCSDCDR